MSRWASFCLILSSSAPATPKDVCFLLFSSSSTPMTAPPTAHQSNSSGLLMTPMRRHTERRSAIWCHGAMTTTWSSTSQKPKR
ncbi:hypothetical protein LDENG_00202840 [Lucifuga dentata]|nr:hypothetical protein LDENG_00202840 [Lucifuga dentata]